MAPLRDQLVSFIAALRDAGVRISVAESIDAMNAVAAVGLERARMHEALAAALIKDEADRAIFDESFNRFFVAPRANRGEHPDQRGDQVSAAAGHGRPGDDPFSLPRDDAPTRGARAAGDRAPSEEKACKASSGGAPPRRERRKDADRAKRPRDFPTRCAAARSAASRRARNRRRPASTPTRVARIRAIERMPFDKFSDLDYDEARDALAPLIRRFRIRLGRRLRLARDRQNRLSTHDSRGAAAWRRADRSQLPCAPSAPCRSRNLSPTSRAPSATRRS